LRFRFCLLGLKDHFEVYRNRMVGSSNHVLFMDIRSSKGMKQSRPCPSAPEKVSAPACIPTFGIVYMFGPPVSIPRQDPGRPKIKRPAMGIQPQNHVKPARVRPKIFRLIHHSMPVREAKEQYGPPEPVRV
jgi:hypothetical protein